jgi:hypothetical protein
VCGRGALGIQKTPNGEEGEKLYSIPKVRKWERWFGERGLPWRRKWETTGPQGVGGLSGRGFLAEDIRGVHSALEMWMHGVTYKVLRFSPDSVMELLGKDSFLLAFSWDGYFFSVGGNII